MNIKVHLAEWLIKFDKKSLEYTIDFNNFSLLNTKMNTTTYSYL